LTSFTNLIHVEHTVWILLGFIYELTWRGTYRLDFTWLHLRTCLTWNISFGFYLTSFTN